jgi:5-methyltetrahydropteroyltriglutamate--homocysteine methyltransferase
VAAGEMTKWFDTNYHYIVPEFTADTEFRLDASRLLAQLAEAGAQGVPAKPVLIGPVTYLALGKAKDDSDKLALLQRLLPVYAELLDTLARRAWNGCRSTSHPGHRAGRRLAHAFNTAYHQLKPAASSCCWRPISASCRTTCTWPPTCRWPACTSMPSTARTTCAPGPAAGHKVLSLGVINGRNIWKTDLNAVLDWLEPLAARLGERLWMAPSCSLLHVPVDLAQRAEAGRRDQVLAGLCAAKARRAALLGRRCARASAVEAELAANAPRWPRAASPRVHNPAVQAAVAAITPTGPAQSPTPARAQQQAALLKLPPSRPPPSARSRRPRRSARRAAPRPASSTPPATGRDAAEIAQRARAGSAGPGRAGARRSRAQRHGRILWRAARRLRLQPVRLGAVLRLALRQAAHPVRRHQPPAP